MIHNNYIFLDEWLNHMFICTSFQETHILHEFSEDFYGEELQVCVVGYIRPEKKFDSLGQWTIIYSHIDGARYTIFSVLDELISEIKNDISQADNLLNKEKFAFYSKALYDYFL